jgi:hypothetical protein
LTFDRGQGGRGRACRARSRPSGSVALVPRRNLIPFALLGALVILALVFAVVGQTSAPNRDTLAVQNATSATFGDPAGSNSFSMNLSLSLSGSLRSRELSQERLITYRSPSQLIVSQRVGAVTHRVAVLGPNAIPCVLRAYTSIVGGDTAWTTDGTTYTRDESLADFSARVPHSSATTCAPQPSAVHGSVAERALLKSGYLVDLTFIVSVPAQHRADGRPATPGLVEGERLQLLTIGGTAVANL